MPAQDNHGGRSGVIGIIVSAMQEEQEHEADAIRQAIHDETVLILEEARALRAEVKEIKDGMGRKRVVALKIADRRASDPSSSGGGRFGIRKARRAHPLASAFMRIT